MKIKSIKEIEKRIRTAKRNAKEAMKNYNLTGESFWNISQMLWATTAWELEWALKKHEPDEKGRVKL